MSVNTELQALLTKMGGSPSEEDSNSDLIKKISNAYEGGGESGGGILIVHMIDTGEHDEGGEEIMEFDKTWKEIHDSVLSILVNEYTDSTIWNIIEAALLPSHPSSCGAYAIAIRENFFSTDSENGYPRSGNARPK